MFETFRESISCVLEKCSPMISVPFVLLGVYFVWRVFFNAIHCDVGFCPITSEPDVKEAFDRCVDDEVSEECEEKIGETLENCENDPLKWTCDYCGIVHRNTDCVCDACGGRRLRW